MLVRDCMSRHLERIDANASIRAAAEQMRALEIGALPVFEGGRLVGMLTDRDLVLRALARGLDSATPLRAVMSAHAVTCFADEDVSAAATLMAREHVRRLVVLDRDLAPVGLLSLDDLVLHGCAGDVVSEALGHAG